VPANWTVLLAFLEIPHDAAATVGMKTLSDCSGISKIAHAQTASDVRVENSWFKGNRVRLAIDHWEIGIPVCETTAISRARKVSR